MGTYAEADYEVIAGVLATLQRHQTRAELAAAFWRRIPGHAWRAERWDERALRLSQLAVEIGDYQLYADIDRRCEAIADWVRRTVAKAAEPTAEERQLLAALAAEVVAEVDAEVRAAGAREAARDAYTTHSTTPGGTQ